MKDIIEGCTKTITEERCVFLSWHLQVICTCGNSSCRRCFVYVVREVSAVYRYTVKSLLQTGFFMEDSGIKVELVSKDQMKDHNSDVIQLWLRIVDPKKRKHSHKENEAIQFDYNINTDNPDTVALEMVNHS